MKRLNFKVNNFKDYKTFIKIKDVKVKEETKKLIIEKKSVSKGPYVRGFTVWHEFSKYVNVETGTSITITDSVGGCGVQHLYNWADYANCIDIGDVLKYIIKNLNKGVGLLTCQIGQNYYKTAIVKALIENGFESYEYDNFQHAQDGSYKGNFYMLKIKR